jgi:hypothetical protein
MAWLSVTARNGSAWAFNPEGAAQIIRTSAYNRFLHKRSQIGRSFYAGSGPMLFQVETDFSGFRQEVNEFAIGSAKRIKSDFDEDPAGFFEFLVNVRADGESAGVAMDKMRREATANSARQLEGDIDLWENVATVAKFVRDVSAGALFVGATVFGVGGALLAGGAGAGLTFAGNLQDNIDARQSLKEATKNAAIATTIAVATNVLIPRFGSAFVLARSSGKVVVQEGGKSTLKPIADFIKSDQVRIGLISAAGNTAGDVVKTGLTNEYAGGPFGAAAREAWLRQAEARGSFELPAALLQAFLLSKAIPAKVMINGIPKDHGGPALLGGSLNALSDRVTAELVSRAASKVPFDLDMVLTEIIDAFTAEEYVRRTAMAPLPGTWRPYAPKR